MIAVVDYGAGNIGSVKNALDNLSQESVVTSDADIIKRANKIILPGVGAFGDAARKLSALGLDRVIVDSCRGETPLLGICLGLQLMFECSEESADTTGLGVFKGQVKRIPDERHSLKIPHIGWNSLSLAQYDGIFKDVNDGAYVYFVHSFYAEPEDASIISAYTDYGAKIPIAFSYKHIHLTQFHPEKSGETGLRILENFVNI